MIGTTISHYKILSPLGQGGMDVVYLAEDTILRRKAVLKFLLPQYLAEPELNARLLREARAAAALNHPNIITIYEVGEAGKQIFIVMEYVEGESLQDLLSRKELTLSEVFDLAGQICEGLAEAHRAGIVHRDLKPSNILLNKTSRVKIADFGLAKLEGASKLTGEGVLMGTLFYMSPEQANSQPLDQRSDIFSLGVILYELITRQLPFRGRDTLAVWRAITGQEPEPLARYKANVSDGLQRMINRALDKNVETRYQHVEDLLADLKDEKKILLKPASSMPAQPLRALPKQVESTMTIATPSQPKIEKRAEDKAPNLRPPPDEKVSKPRRPIAAPPLPKVEKRAEDKAPILPRDEKTAKRKFWPIAIVSGVVLLLALWVLSNIRDQKIENEPPAATKTSPPTGKAFIPGGSFMMGSDYDDEKPEHQVYVDAFYFYLDRL